MVSKAVQELSQSSYLDNKLPDLYAKVHSHEGVFCTSSNEVKRTLGAVC